MMDNIFHDAMVATVFVSGLFAWAFVNRGKRQSLTDKRLDRTIQSLQNEAKERGKLSRRLAKAETKIARLLHEAKKGPTPGRGAGQV